MKKILAFVALGLLLTIVKAFSNPGDTGKNGCHMDSLKHKYHCHLEEQTNTFIVHYYINYQNQTFGPYLSFSSCMSVLKATNIMASCSDYQEFEIRK